LLPTRPKSEEVAFIFCGANQREGEVLFSFVASYSVTPTDFVHRSLFGIELSDACHAKVIKQAHDLGAALIEVHSHPLTKVTAFSLSDIQGFVDSVPHVRWRLKQRPYAAIVVGPRGFDSLYWFSSSGQPDGVLEVQVGEKRLLPTGVTLTKWRDQNGL
jgi:hypothetical protein